MPAPDVAATTDRLYRRLPAIYRHADRAQEDTGPVGWPLLRYLSTVVDQAGDVEELVDRFAFDPHDDDPDMATSDLTDPQAADPAWLPWLAQLVGVHLAPRLSTVARRDAIEGASAGWRAGTRRAIRDAARSELTGERHVTVHRHRTTLADGGEGAWYDLLIVTRPSETPDEADVLDAIDAKGARPAGVLIRWEAYVATWATVESVHPTWADWEAAGSWQAIEETLPPAA